VDLDVEVRMGQALKDNFTSGDGHADFYSVESELELDAVEEVAFSFHVFREEALVLLV